MLEISKFFRERMYLFIAQMFLQTSPLELGIEFPVHFFNCKSLPQDFPHN